MKNRMNRIACKLTAAVVVFGLTGWLPPRALRSHSCASARAADRPADALPAWQGEKAVEEPKERGLYASLQEAMAATRYEISREERTGLRRLPPSYQAPNPLEVEEDVTTYPVTIDTLFTQPFTHQQKLTANDGAVRWFGHSIAISGDTVVVGAPDADYHRGSAYVFARSGGSWGAPQRLLASDGAMGDFFGSSVAISGDTVVVGAPGDIGSRKIEPRKDQGSAYVFARSGESWNQLRNLTADDGALGDQFGASVAISDNTVVVGAHYNNKKQGSAYVFSRR
jgi:hypothetical protein